jgi:hypothetical protein
MIRPICNPIDLPYRVQQVVNGRRRRVFREPADPSVIRYLLFASMSGGFWHSADLRHRCRARLHLLRLARRLVARGDHADRRPHLVARRPRRDR